MFDCVHTFVDTCVVENLCFICVVLAQGVPKEVDTRVQHAFSKNGAVFSDEFFLSSVIMDLLVSTPLEPPLTHMWSKVATFSPQITHRRRKTSFSFGKMRDFSQKSNLVWRRKYLRLDETFGGGGTEDVCRGGCQRERLMQRASSRVKVQHSADFSVTHAHTCTHTHKREYE